MKDFRTLDPAMTLEANPTRVRPHYVDKETGIEYWHTANRTIYGANEAVTDKFIAEVAAECDLHDVDMAIGATVSKVSDGRQLPEIGEPVVIERGVGRIGLYGAAGHTDDDYMEKLAYFGQRMTSYDAILQRPFMNAEKTVIEQADRK